MKLPLIRQGEGPAAAFHRIAQEREQERRRLARIINDTTELATPTARGRRLIAARSPAGDEKRLRGIPAIGRGVTGAIPGTKPGT